MTYLPDVNVWIALAVVGHTHEAAALNWFSEIYESDEVLFCRITQAGFLRLLTNSKAMMDDVRTPPKAWGEYDLWTRAAKARLEPEPLGFEEAWRAATQHPYTGRDYWTDAYLAAFAQAAGFTVVTFDKAFQKNHKGVQAKILSA